MPRYYKAPVTPRYYRYGAQPERWTSGWSVQTPPSTTHPAHERDLGNASFVDSFYSGTFGTGLQKSYLLPSTPVAPAIAAKTGGPRYGAPEPLSPQIYAMSGYSGDILKGLAVVGVALLALKLVK